MEEDCVIRAMTYLKWINPLSSEEKKQVMDSTTLDNQLLLLQPKLKNHIGTTEFVTAIGQDNLFQWVNKLYKQYGDGVLVIWFDDITTRAHTVIIKNGELLDDTGSMQFALHLSNVYILKYLYKIQ